MSVHSHRLRVQALCGGEPRRIHGENEAEIWLFGTDLYDDDVPIAIEVPLILDPMTL